MGDILPYVIMILIHYLIIILDFLLIKCLLRMRFNLLDTESERSERRLHNKRRIHVGIYANLTALFGFII